MGHRMRRALSILLVLLFGAGPLSFAFNASDEASLPACCRRLGAHHCAMNNQQAQDVAANAALKARSRCPQFPQHPDARTTSFGAALREYHAAAHEAGEVRRSVPARSPCSSIYLRTPVLRGPPATRAS